MNQVKPFIFLICLFLPGFVSVPAIAQQTVGEKQIPVNYATATFYGSVAWQQPDGNALRGRISLDVSGGKASKLRPNGRRLAAYLDFSTPDGEVIYSYLFAGKMDPNGRGYLRYQADNGGTHPFPLPSLNPGKVCVHLTSGQQVASGGVMAADGTQLTFRAEYDHTYVLDGSPSLPNEPH